MNTLRILFLIILLGRRRGFPLRHCDTTDRILLSRFHFRLNTEVCIQKCLVIFVLKNLPVAFCLGRGCNLYSGP